MSAGVGIRRSTGCPTCGAPTRVLETRTNDRGVRRRRACVIISCPGRITTLEVVIPSRDDSTDYILVSRSKLTSVASHLADVLQEQVGSSEDE